MAHVAKLGTMAAETGRCRRHQASRVDVLGADDHAGASQGCRNHRQADGGRADDPDDDRGRP